MSWWFTSLELITDFFGQGIEACATRMET